METYDGEFHMDLSREEEEVMYANTSYQREKRVCIDTEKGMGSRKVEGNSSETTR
jgi:hypothetical protein